LKRRELNLGWMDLKSLPLECCDPYLVVLELMGNSISTLPPHIQYLSSLQLLNLAENTLTKLPPEIGFFFGVFLSEWPSPCPLFFLFCSLIYFCLVEFVKKITLVVKCFVEGINVVKCFIEGVKRLYWVSKGQQFRTRLFQHKFPSTSPTTRCLLTHTTTFNS